MCSDFEDQGELPTWEHEEGLFMMQKVGHRTELKTGLVASFKGGVKY